MAWDSRGCKVQREKRESTSERSPGGALGVASRGDPVTVTGHSPGLVAGMETQWPLGVLGAE